MAQTWDKSGFYVNALYKFSSKYESPIHIYVTSRRLPVWAVLTSHRVWNSFRFISNLKLPHSFIEYPVTYAVSMVGSHGLMTPRPLTIDRVIPSVCDRKSFIPRSFWYTPKKLVSFNADRDLHNTCSVNIICMQGLEVLTLFQSSTVSELCEKSGLFPKK